MKSICQSSVITKTSLMIWNAVAAIFFLVASNALAGPSDPPWSDSPHSLCPHNTVLSHSVPVCNSSIELLACWDDRIVCAGTKVYDPLRGAGYEFMSGLEVRLTGSLYYLPCGENPNQPLYEVVPNVLTRQPFGFPQTVTIKRKVRCHPDIPCIEYSVQIPVIVKDQSRLGCAEPRGSYCSIPNPRVWSVFKNVYTRADLTIQTETSPDDGMPRSYTTGYKYIPSIQDECSARVDMQYLTEMKLEYYLLVNPGLLEMNLAQAGFGAVLYNGGGNVNAQDGISTQPRPSYNLNLGVVTLPVAFAVKREKSGLERIALPKGIETRWCTNVNDETIEILDFVIGKVASIAQVEGAAWKEEAHVEVEVSLYEKPPTDSKVFEWSNPSCQ